VEITSPDAGPPAAPAPVAAAAFPKPAAAPSAAELSAMAGILQLPATPAELATHAVLLSSDWTTQGTWVGRYGRYQSTEPELPGNIKWGSGVLRMPFRCSQGMTNMLTYWTSSNYLQDPRAMEMNSVYFDTRIAQALTTPEVNRRQTEWNDGGNNVPRGGNGPGLYADIQVPEGAYEVGFYHDNDNGYQTRNRYRDFTVSVRENPSGTSVQNHNEFAQWPEITRSRIHEFWGGVYTRLLVKGPAAFTVQIGRNHSFNTTLNGLFVDPIDEYPEPYFGDLPGATVANTPPARPNASEADRLLALLETMHSQNLQRYGIMYRSMFTALARWYQDALAQSPAAADATGLQRQLATCCYRLGLFDQWESLQHDMKLHTCRDIEKSLRWDHVADDADLSSLNRPMVIAYRKGAPAGSH
jgi:hypothetical protein